MPVTYPLSFPSAPVAERAQLGMRNIVAASRSPYSLDSQQQRHQGQQWLADLSIPPLQGAAELGAWAAFLTALRGRYGTFTWGPPDRNQGTAPGTPVVNGAIQTGESLATRGWSVSATGVLKAGDLIQIGSGGASRMYRVLLDVDSDASGNAAIDVWPRLRESPADGAAVLTSDAVGLWRLTDNAPAILLEPAIIARVSFTIEEAL